MGVTYLCSRPNHARKRVGASSVHIVSTGRSSRRGNISTASASLVVVVLLAAGAAAGIALPRSATPEDGGETSSAQVDVVTQQFEDARSVSVAPVTAEPSTLAVSQVGIVTSTQCIAGATIASGTSPVAVNGQPIIALATSSPLWRDLAIGDEGPDVRALQDELARLGYGVDPDGNYGRATSSAVIALFNDVGVVKHDGTVTLSRMMWLPAPAVTLGSCDLPLGAMAGTDPFATTTTPLTGLRISGDITGAVPGERVVRHGAVAASVDPDGQITDPTMLAEVAESPEYQLWQSQGSSASPITLEYALSEPLNVNLVPPSALFGLANGSGCVSVDGVAQSVSVIASPLGQTMVVFDDGSTPAHVDLPPSHSEDGAASDLSLNCTG